MNKNIHRFINIIIICLCALILGISIVEVTQGNKGYSLLALASVAYAIMVYRHGFNADKE